MNREKCCKSSEALYMSIELRQHCDAIANTEQGSALGDINTSAF